MLIFGISTHTQKIKRIVHLKIKSCHHLLSFQTGLIFFYRTHTEMLFSHLLKDSEMIQINIGRIKAFRLSHVNIDSETVSGSSHEPSHDPRRTGSNSPFRLIKISSSYHKQRETLRSSRQPVKIKVWLNLKKLLQKYILLLYNRMQVLM